MSCSKPKTRSFVKCPVFGYPKILNDSKLPTFEEVFQYYLHLKNEMKLSVNSKEPTVSQISETVVIKIMEIWAKASIPTVSHTRILAMVRSYHDKYIKLMKPFKGRSMNKNYILRLASFKKEAREKLFDICSCKCKDISTCCCNKLQKIPPKEFIFLEDQRTLRQMVIGGIDAVATKCLEQQQKRKAISAAHMAKRQKCYGNEDFERLSEEELEAQPKSPEWCMPNANLRLDKDYKNITCNLPMLARSCDRYGVSDRAGSMIASAVLEDIDLIDTANTNFVVDRCKLRRERQKYRRTLRKRQHLNSLRGLYFDGCKDKTLILVKKGVKYYKKQEVQEHVTLVQEPEGQYIGHVSPLSGTANNLKGQIINFLEENEINTADFVAVGCDGTNVNTGINNGVIRLLEMHIERPLQWFICQLHGNELLLRHLFQNLDGSTNGPKAFSGPIGKALIGCEVLPVSNFKKIEIVLPRSLNKIKDLSTDQQYLLDICQSISLGNCSKDLLCRNPGKLCHSRWVTTANRILRLYVGSPSPTKVLQTLATFVMKVYAPMWFEIKCKPSCKHGALHLFSTIKKTSYLPQELKNVIYPVIQRNGYFGHPENLLLCMMTDNRQHIRELALRRIMLARKQQNIIPRKFILPHFNFLASDYIDLIDWKQNAITEPPITSTVSSFELEQFIRSTETPLIDFPQFPCHTQVVERCVKLVTEASTSVCGYEARDGFIRSKQESHKAIKCFNTKSEYKPSAF